MRTSRTPARSLATSASRRSTCFPTPSERERRGRRADQVPPEAKAARTARLRALSDELAAADRASRVGTVELALVETPETATAESYHEVPAPAGAKIGSLVPAKVG